MFAAFRAVVLRVLFEKKQSEGWVEINIARKEKAKKIRQIQRASARQGKPKGKRHGLSYVSVQRHA